MKKWVPQGGSVLWSTTRMPAVSRQRCESNKCKAHLKKGQRSLDTSCAWRGRESRPQADRTHRTTLPKCGRPHHRQPLSRPSPGLMPGPKRTQHTHINKACPKPTHVLTKKTLAQPQAFEKPRKLAASRGQEVVPNARKG